tara:strand:- start:614 stop:2134 length:1521 start_codon:yes stop_codon:yes gene_type:complete
MKFEDSRIRILVDTPLNKSGEFVLYWMTAQRRATWNPALQHAADLAEMLNRPLLVVEPFSSDYSFASDRLVTFVVQGMLDNRKSFEELGIRYIPWVETHRERGAGLLSRIASKSCVVVIDDFPCGHPRFVLERAQKILDTRLHAVDGCGVIPMSWTDKAPPLAHTFRRVVQRRILDVILDGPKENPLESRSNVLSISDNQYESLMESLDFEGTPLEWLWRVAEGGITGREALNPLPIDHDVFPVSNCRGGSVEANRLLEIFINKKVAHYSDGRNNPSNCTTSRLSPWLHFGHISALEVVHRVLQKYQWDPSMSSEKVSGSRHGWWGLDEAPESFLDQIITWRDLGFHFAYHRPDYASFESIPEWAQMTLINHANDPRPSYSFQELEDAETHDEIWNAAQRELKETGVIHNYLRMLWGKRILEWAPDPVTASKWMVDLNDRWALDGRDPNSYTGIFWVLGRHDRAWGPERPVFGKVRFMSSANTARKLDLSGYLSQFGSDTSDRIEG